MQIDYSIYNASKKLRFISGEASPDMKKRLKTLKNRKEVLEKWEVLKVNKVPLSDIELILETSKATLYRWKKELLPKSKKPKNLRKPMWSLDLELKVKKIRLENPLFGKEKIHIILARQGVRTSQSTVGRIITKLRNKKQVFACHQISGIKKFKKKRNFDKHAIRLPKGLKSKAVGELVQVDHLTTRVGEKTVKHFNAWDRLSKYNVSGVYLNATSYSAAKFLDELIKEAPFKIKSIQVDGGSEFMKDFEQSCKEKGIKLFVIPPYTPQINGGVERINRTWREEFYNFYDDLPENILQLNTRVKEYQNKYNTFRPHKNLDFLTPIEYLQNNSLM